MLRARLTCYGNMFSASGAPPEDIICDRDPRFISRYITTFCKRLGTKLRASTAFHPQTDGQTERMNRSLEDYLRQYVGHQQSDWDQHLPNAEYCINTSYNASIQDTPYHLVYGKHIKPPIAAPARKTNYKKAQHNKGTVGEAPAAHIRMEALWANWQRAKTALQAAQQRQKTYADKRRRHVEFAVGDKVKLKTVNLNILTKDGSKKFMPKWWGPLQVTEKVSSHAYRLKLPDSWRVHDVFNISYLERWVDRPNATSDDAPAPVVLNVEEWWFVDHVLDHRPKHYDLTSVPDSGYTGKASLKLKGHGSHTNW